MDKVRITYKNQSKLFDKNTTYYEISKSFHVSENILAAKVNNVIMHLSEKATKDDMIDFIDITDVYGHKLYKSALEFIFEVAVKEILPNAEVNFEHSVPKGVLVEIKYAKELSYEELSKIKQKMSTIILDDIPFKKLTILKTEAIEFYKKENYKEKADNIQYISDKVVSIFELNGKYNYFYSGMPYSTGVITQYEIKSIGRNKLVIIMPDQQGKLPDYSPCTNIINSFYRGKCLLDDLHINYLSDLNKTVCNGDIKDFIKSCELVFNLELAKVAKKISDNRNIKFVLIAGPSSSGKTTTCSRLADYLRANGYDPIKISVDDYFVDRNDTPTDESGKPDYECLTAINLEELNNDLEKLLNGKTIKMSRYNFISGKREQLDKDISMKNNSIFLIEGLHAINDELTPKINPKYKYKIYLSPFIPLNIDRHNYISTLDLRLIRRIIRDNRTRGYDVVKTIDNWRSVRNGEEKYIFPYIPQANVIINTAQPYEVGVLKVFVEPLLYTVDVNNEYYEEARRIINFLKPFFQIPGEYVPENSILREFIGGKND